MGTLLVLGLLLPLFGFGLNRLFGAANRPGVRVMGPVAILASFTCFLVAALANGGGHTDFTVYRWMEQAGGPTAGLPVPAVNFNLYFDPLAAVMTLVVTGVGFLIHAYAAGYMDEENDTDYARFFAHMNLFVFSMLVLVLARNFILLTVGWAMVGLSSYLLIGFYHQRPAAVLAARKAFVMNVVGDVGIVIASLVAFHALGNLSFDALFAAGPLCGGAGSHVCNASDHLTHSEVELVGFFLLVGAVAKSAQVPLHTWLPDAMEGPTPVSALIHAATMVTAGVYLIARFQPLYANAPAAANTAAVLGAVTALMAAALACVQSDIKRVLAYSTMSQVGYMFFAVAIGAEVAGVFHLVTHAFFKALLFLAAGNVIHALGGEQDMRRMGGLWPAMPVTRWLFLIGTFALAGVVPLSGFFSKDEIISAGLAHGPLHPFLGLVLVAVAAMTAYYMFRAFLVTFMGERQDADRHVHEAEGTMVVPALALAVLAAFGGLVQPGFWHLLTDYLAPVFSTGESSDGARLLTVTLSLVAVGAGMVAAYALYSTQPQARARRPVNALLERRFLWDDMYNAIVVNPLWAAGGALDSWVEAPVVVGVTEAASRVSLLAGRQVRRLQSGYLRSYAMVFAAAALVIVVAFGVGAR
ncbi:MAG: NADH-quinone oxidoreductase subunit L [Candidatus Dormibacteria bacterium]